MSDSKTHLLQANEGALEFPLRQVEQAQGIIAAYAALRQQLRDAEEEIQQLLQKIKHNKEYIAQHQLPLLKQELEELWTMAKLLEDNHPLQEEIIRKMNLRETLIAQISATPDGILPDVKKAEEANLRFEQDLHDFYNTRATLQQNLESKEAELQALNLAGIRVNIPWSFFQGPSAASDDEADEPAPTTFRTLNRSYNDRH